MSFLRKLFGKEPVPAPALVAFNVPAALPKLSAPSAAPIALAAGIEATPGHPPSSLAPQAYLDALLKQQKPIEVVKFLAYGLPEHDSVRWASVSCDLVEANQAAEDRQATSAAKQWLDRPTAANQKAAASAASKAGFKGPGAWAAQAAAWAGPSPSTGSGGVTRPTGASKGAPASGDLVGKAVTGSIMLSAALAKGPITLNLPAIPQVPPLPGLPSLPGVPGMQSLPGMPAVPGMPSVPGVPSLSSVPPVPKIPLPEVRLPGLPSLPGAPALPGMPAVPGMPPLPGVPSLPALPGAPAMPLLQLEGPELCAIYKDVIDRGLTIAAEPA